MSVRWDPLLARATARELDGELRGSRVRAFLLDPDSRRLDVFLREATLVLELHPTRGWLALLPARDPPTEARSLPARVLGVEAPPDESLLRFGLPRIRGKDEGLELVVELVGNRWNAVVVGHRTGVIRHVLVPRRERSRSLAVGALYQAPPSTGREGASEPISRARWEEILTKGDGEDGRRKALLRNVAWTSSLNAELFLTDDGWEAWRRATDPDGWGSYVLTTGRGHQPYPLPLPGTEPHEAPSLLEAFQLAREQDPETGPLHELLIPPGLLERGEERAHRARRKAEALRKELERSRDPEPIRALGDLILARYGEIPKGAERASLEGFEGERVEVELDPGLSPDENAAGYYDEAARLERARATLPDRIREAEERAREWTELLDGVRSGEIPPARLAERLPPTGTPGARGRGDARRGPSLPYRRYRSSGGLEIRVGRGSRANDDLTFHHSSPDDVWLHARQAPGAHVILRWGRDGNPPRRDLAEAAILAALHSDARHSGSVPVDWTRRKYVRKPRKAAPGAVVPERIQTLFVEPDPELAERLEEVSE